MAAFHYVTNRGLHLIATGQVAGASDVYVGLYTGASVPAAIDSEAEITDLNTVAQLLALTAVDEPVGVWYTRNTLSGLTATEDDVNDRENIDALNSTWVNATTGETIAGFFIAKEGGTDAFDQLISVGSFDPPVPTNGSNLAATINDLFRLVRI